MTRSATATRLIQLLRNVSDRETFVTQFLREGLRWPKLELASVESPRVPEPDSLSMQSIRFSTTSPPFNVFLAEANSEFISANQPATRRQLFQRILAANEPASASLVFLTFGWRSYSVWLLDAAPTAGYSASFTLDSAALESAEAVGGVLLRRLAWPAPEVIANATDWAARWKKAFDQHELANWFLRQLRRAASLVAEPAVLREAVFARIMGGPPATAPELSFLNRFPFTDREDSDHDVQLAIDPSILAALHEAGTLSEETTAGDSAAVRKKTGSFFTPTPIAHFMSREALREYLAHRLTAETGAGRAASLARIETLFQDSHPQPGDRDSAFPFTPSEATSLRRAVFDCRVCDPAVGGGALLVAMLHEMTAIVTRLSTFLDGSDASETNDIELDFRRRIAASCLYGIDIQSDAVDVCRRRLRFAVREESPDSPATEFERHIRQADALFDSPETLFGETRAFDIVIANPPYRSYGLRGNRNARRDWAAKVRERFPGSAEYKISLYALFFELGLNLCRNNGVLCFLTPDSFLLGRYFSRLRRLLLERTAIHRLVMFAGDFWKSGAVGRPTISLLHAGGEGDVTDASLAVDADSLRHASFQRLAHRQSDFSTNPHDRFRLFFSETAREFVKFVEAGSSPMSSCARITTGVRSRSSQKQIVATEHRGPEWQPGLVSGSQVTPFAVHWRGHYLKIAPDELYAGGWDPQVVQQPKLLIRQTGDSLIAAIDVNCYFHLNNIHALSPHTPTVSLRYLCAILNSRLMNRYYHLISLEQGRSMAQTDIETIGLLPLRQSDATTIGNIERLVECVADAEARRKLDELVEAVYDPSGVFREYLRGEELYPATAVSRGVGRE